MKLYEQYTRPFLIAGVLLFLLGLLNGFVLQQFANPRMALSAHLAAMQNALVLVVFGLVQKYLHQTAAAARWCYWLGVHGLYAIWVSLLLAAIWGTSGATPIAGAGFSASAVRENTVNVLLYSGSLAITVCTVLVLRALIGGKQTDT